MADSGNIDTSGSAAWRSELKLVGHLSRVNRQITSYIMRSLDADAGRTEPTPPIDEAMLGAQLFVVGKMLIERAEERQPGVSELIIDEIEVVGQGHDQQ